MIPRNDIEKILGAAIMAPSGENAQPWRFEVDGNSIDLFNVPERDTSLYNWEQRASYMANGTTLENLVIAAGHFGYNAEVNIFPDKNENHVASIKLEKTATNNSVLFDAISKRATNRKPYKQEPLTDKVVNQFLALKTKDINIKITTVKSEIDRLGQVGSTNERVMLSNESLHKFFFSHVNWNKKEDNAKKVGFFIETLELPPPAKAMFRLLSRWTVMKWFLKLKFNNVIGKQNGTTNAKAGAFGILTITNLKPETFVQAGRVLERIWLQATDQGLSLQPLTGILFFKLQILAGNTSAFSKDQLEMINVAYNEVTKIFNINESEHVVFMFRLGYADEPTARSSRFKLDEVSSIK